MSESSDDPVARIPEGPLAEELHIGERLTSDEAHAVADDAAADHGTIDGTIDGSIDGDATDDEHLDDEPS